MQHNAFVQLIILIVICAVVYYVLSLLPISDIFKRLVLAVMVLGLLFAALSLFHLLDRVSRWG